MLWQDSRIVPRCVCMCMCVSEYFMVCEYVLVVCEYVIVYVYVCVKRSKKSM